MGLFLHVPGGREYLVQVPGVAHAPVDSKRLAALLNYALERYSRREIPPDFKPYEAEEVARLRASPLQDVRPVRRQLIVAMERRGLLEAR